MTLNFELFEQLNLKYFVVILDQIKMIIPCEDNVSVAILKEIETFYFLEIEFNNWMSICLKFVPTALLFLRVEVFINILRNITPIPILISPYGTICSTSDSLRFTLSDHNLLIQSNHSHDMILYKETTTGEVKIKITEAKLSSISIELRLGFYLMADNHDERTVWGSTAGLSQILKQYLIKDMRVTFQLEKNIKSNQTSVTPRNAFAKPTSKDLYISLNSTEDPLVDIHNIQSWLTE